MVARRAAADRRGPATSRGNRAHRRNPGDDSQRCQPGVIIRHIVQGTTRSPKVRSSWRLPLETTVVNAEQRRLEESRVRTAHWKRWGPYLSERAWGTVREDYSPHGTAWDYFPHDHARSRAYRWNEDGIAGICDRHQVICFALALWNERDPILKERMFGLTGNEGNHGEDVKEYYF